MTGGGEDKNDQKFVTLLNDPKVLQSCPWIGFNNVSGRIESEKHHRSSRLGSGRKYLSKAKDRVVSYVECGGSSLG